MVYLSRIYTKTGDDGTTALGNGQRVPKDHARVEACGCVDELNAVLGLLMAQSGDFPQRDVVAMVCNDLFDVGADLCVPIKQDVPEDSSLRIVASQVDRLEAAIDALNQSLQPLNSFIVRGGTVSASWAHLACTVCRRAERRIVTLAALEPINPLVVVYLNRLSDFLFVLARTLNDFGRADVLWQPGKGRVS
jgi:cob(I)alamin adenosyltransferase